jgi:hypothetical protein
LALRNSAIGYINPATQFSGHVEAAAQVLEAHLVLSLSIAR